MENIIELLKNSGFKTIQTRTIHGSGSTFYQLEKEGVVYPKSRGNKADVGEETMVTCFDKFGLKGVLNIFDASDA